MLACFGSQNPFLRLSFPMFSPTISATAKDNAIMLKLK